MAQGRGGRGARGARGQKGGKGRGGGDTIGNGGDSTAMVSTLDGVRKSNGKSKYSPPGSNSGAEQVEQGSRNGRLETARKSACTSTIVTPTSTSGTVNTSTVSDMASQVNSATDRNIEMLQVRSKIPLYMLITHG